MDHIIPKMLPKAEGMKPKPMVPLTVRRTRSEVRLKRPHIDRRIAPITGALRKKINQMLDKVKDTTFKLPELNILTRPKRQKKAPSKMDL